MEINSKSFGNIGILKLKGEVDAESAPQFKKALAKARGESFEHFVLDLSNVPFIDSTGLGVFISLLRQLKEEGAHLRLTGLQEEVKSIFQITRLFRVFDISDSVEVACEEIRDQI